MIKLIQTHNKPIAVQWIPSCVKIIGNKAAYELAEKDAEERPRVLFLRKAKKKYDRLSKKSVEK